MVALGDADAMVTGTTRNYSTALQDVRRCIDVKPGHRMIGVSLALCRGRTVLVADTAVIDMPIRRGTGRHRRGSRRHGPPPGLRAARGDARLFHLRSPDRRTVRAVRDAVRILDKRRVDFEYDGEMAADVALNSEVMEQYPFCRLSGTANVLVMPAFHSASISTKMLQELGGSTVIGPLLVGLDKSIQIVSHGRQGLPTSSTWRRSPPTTRRTEGR
jgi:malate dehydrogenase (oxaloacetate-decarboxylating)(NADP+)